jgi:hypothetical protein
VGIGSVFYVQRVAIHRETVYVAAKGGNFIRGSEVPAIWLMLTPPNRERVFIDSAVFYRDSPLGLQWGNLDQVYHEFVRTKAAR